MQKLTKLEPNIYLINHKKPFNDINLISVKDIEKAFQFAFEMSFGKGHHRTHRTGGQTKRKKGEIFCNTFQGKLAEIVLYNYFTSRKINCTEVDYRIMGKNEWDDYDFVINNKKINVKSSTFFSNLLLLETKDWDQNGNYIPNQNNENNTQYDFFVLIRIKPDLKALLSRNRLYYSNEIDKGILNKIINNEKWSYDIPGFITNKEFVQEVIKGQQIIPQNSLLNNKTPMDAENYYIQSGDLQDINNIISFLN